MIDLVWWMDRFFKSFVTCQFVIRPPAQITGLAGELVLYVLIVLTGSADPAAAYLTFPDHLQPGVWTSLQFNLLRFERKIRHNVPLKWINDGGYSSNNTEHLKKHLKPWEGFIPVCLEQESDATLNTRFTKTEQVKIFHLVEPVPNDSCSWLQGLCNLRFFSAHWGCNEWAMLDFLELEFSKLRLDKCTNKPELQLMLHLNIHLILYTLSQQNRVPWSVPWNKARCRRSAPSRYGWSSACNRRY